jgi:FkbM family methyltransferase
MPLVSIPADQLYQAAWQAFSRGAINEAEGIIRQTLAIHPTHVPASLLLGQILERSGRRPQAIAAYEHAAALLPGNGLPFTRLSISRFRAAFGDPLLPRVSATDRPAVSMTSLGAHGRFGNQLLQYAFIRLYAAEHGLVAEVADWIGRDLFDLDDPLPSRNLPRIAEGRVDLMAALNNPLTVLSNCDVVGYFCGPTHLWGQRRQQFRALFHPGHNLVPLLDRAIDAIGRKGKTLVAVHLRRGDFGWGRFWLAPAHWYVKWLDEIWDGLDRPVLYIASDDPNATCEFAKFAPLNAEMLGVNIPGAEFYLDHYILSRARHLAISNSTFSFTAAMINSDAASFARPDPTQRCIVSFDPWDADTLIDAKDDGSLPNHERTIIRNVVRSDGLVIYIGESCSPWTIVARSTHRELRVFETLDAPVDRLRAAHHISQVGDLVIERSCDAAAVLTGSRDSLGYARIDCIHFPIDELADAVGILARLAAEDFAIFRITTDSRFEPIPLGAPPSTGRYLALQNRLLPLFLGRKSSGLDIVALCSQHRIRVHGILHVGAHEGQEMSTYDALQARRVLFAEANPTVYARLIESMTGRPHVVCVNRAVCDREGPVMLHLTSFDQSSSLYPLARHRHVYPQILPSGSVEVPGVTLDALLDQLGLSHADFNFLHIDVQGAEALVLKGATSVLRHVEAISIEVNFIELYHGGAQIEVIEDLLRPIGFRRVAMISAYHPSWGDAFYVRATKAGT